MSALYNMLKLRRELLARRLDELRAVPDTVDQARAAEALALANALAEHDAVIESGLVQPTRGRVSAETDADPAIDVRRVLALRLKANLTSQEIAELDERVLRLTEARADQVVDILLDDAVSRLDDALGKLS